MPTYWQLSSFLPGTCCSEASAWAGTSEGRSSEGEREAPPVTPRGRHGNSLLEHARLASENSREGTRSAKAKK